MERARQVGRALLATINRTRATVESLADHSGNRYVIRSESWKANLPILRKITIVPLSDLQASYSSLATVRNNYDVLVPRIIDYLSSLDALFTGTKAIDAERLTGTLVAEHLAFQIGIAYGSDLATAAEKLALIQKRLVTKGG